MQAPAENPKAPHIVVVGGLNMDLVVRVPVIPKPGETAEGNSFATFPGGKGANQAVAAARLGGRVSMVGRVGQDAFGEQLLDNIRREGIQADQVGIDPDSATGVALITVENSGQNNISVASGANLRVTPEQVHQALAAIGSFDILLMPLEIPMPSILAAAQAAEQAGALIVLNPSPAKAMPGDLLALANVMVPNEIEVAQLTGIPVTDDASTIQAILKLAEITNQARVLVTLGSRGAAFVESDAAGERLVHIPPFKVPVVDTTAAGDAYVAGLCVALGERQLFPDAARFAAAAGALAVTRAGAQPSLPRREEVIHLLQGERA